jgi:hypothetical protein
MYMLLFLVSCILYRNGVHPGFWVRESLIVLGRKALRQSHGCLACGLRAVQGILRSCGSLSRALQSELARCVAMAALRRLAVVCHGGEEEGMRNA